MDDTNEKLLKAGVSLEEAEKQQLVSEDEVKALQRRIILLDDDLNIVEQRLSVETKKLEEVNVMTIPHLQSSMSSWALILISPSQLSASLNSHSPPPIASISSLPSFFLPCDLLFLLPFIRCFSPLLLLLLLLIK